MLSKRPQAYHHALSQLHYEFGGVSGALNAHLSGGNVWEGAVEGTLTGGVGAAITMATGANVITAGIGVAIGVTTGAIVDGAVQVGSQIVNDDYVDLHDINLARMGKTGLETGLLTLIPGLKGFETETAMAFGTSFISGEATVVTSIFDGAITDMINR